MTVTGFVTFVVLGLLSYCAFCLSRFLYKDSFAPVGLFLGISLASLSLYHLRLLWLAPGSTDAHLLIFASMFSFLVGALMASPRIVVKGRPVIKRDLFQEHHGDAKGLALFYYGTGLLVTAGWILQLFLLLSDYPLTEIIAMPYVLQENFQRQYVGYLNLVGILIPPSFVLLSLARRRVTMITALFLASAFVGLVLAGIKSYLIFSLVASLLVWSAARPGRINLRSLAVVFVFVLGFMCLYDYFIDIFVPKQFAGSMFPEAFSSLERPYLYLVGSWPAMSALMENPPGQPHWAFLSLHLVWKILGAGLGLIPKVPDYEPALDIGACDFNVYSLIGGLYWDYGPLGPVIGCALLGYVSTLLYIKARERGNWSLYLSSTIFSYGLFLSFFCYYYRFGLLFLFIYALLFGFVARKFSLFGSEHWMRYVFARKSTVRNIYLERPQMTLFRRP